MLRSLLAVLAVCALPLAQANEAEALFKSKPCVACHSAETKMLGPTFKDVATKYAADVNAAANIANSIKSGSSGKWGAIPMPPNAVTEQEALMLAEWILSHK